MKYNRSRLCGNKSLAKVQTQMHVVRRAGSSKETTEFVNHGLLLWKQGRQKWLGRRKHQSRLFHVPKVRHEIVRKRVESNICFGKGRIIDKLQIFQAINGSQKKKRTLCLSMSKKFWLCRGNMSDHRFLESSTLFPKPIPLSEMVDLLVAIWEEEGIYD